MLIKPWRKAQTSSSHGWFCYIPLFFSYIECILPLYYIYTSQELLPGTHTHFFPNEGGISQASISKVFYNSGYNSFYRILNYCRASNRILQMNKKICMWKSDIKCRGLLNIMRPNIMSYFLYVPLKFMISFKPYWSALLFTSCNQWIETLRPDIKLHKGVYLKYRTVISKLL